MLNKNVYLVEQVNNNNVCKNLNAPEDNSQNDLFFCESFVPFLWYLSDEVKLSFHFLLKYNFHFYILWGKILIFWENATKMLE